MLQRERLKCQLPSLHSSAPTSTIMMVLIFHLREENPAMCKQGICSTGCLCLALSIVLHNTAGPMHLILEALRQCWPQWIPVQQGQRTSPSLVWAAAAEPKAGWLHGDVSRDPGQQAVPGVLPLCPQGWGSVSRVGWQVVGVQMWELGWSFTSSLG